MHSPPTDANHDTFRPTVDTVAQQLIARLQKNPADAPAYEELRTHFRNTGDSTPLIELLLEWARNHGDTPHAAALVAEAGNVATDSVGTEARAEALFRQALSIDLHCVQAVAGLQGWLTLKERVADAAVFLSEHIRQLQERAQPGSQPLLSDLYVNLAFILRDQLGDPDGAATCLERALSLDPSNQQALQALQAQAKPGAAAPPGDGAPQEGRASSSTDVNPDLNTDVNPDLNTAVNADVNTTTAGYVPVPLPADDDDSVPAEFARRAAHEADDMGDLDVAIDTLRQALREVPGDVHIMHQLASYLTRRAAQSDDHASTLDLRRAAELFYQIGQGIAEGDAEAAIGYLESALVAEPGHDGALDLLEQLAADCGQEHRLPTYWLAFLANASPGPEADSRRLSLGRAYAAAGQVDDAIYCLEQLPHNHAEASAILGTLLAQRTAQAPPNEPPPQGGPYMPPMRGPRRPTPSEMRRADDAARVSSLRKDVHQLIAENRQEEAASKCREIVDIDPCDPEAFHFLENHLRRARDYRALRDLLVASTRTPGVPVDTRRSRLLEVANLSERKLDDVNTAIAALQGVVTLSSTDGEAARHLKTLLRQTERWDDLVSLLEREALSATDTESKAAMLAELADVHELHRSDQDECAAVLTQLHDLRPDDESVRDRLCTLLLAQGRYDSALPILERRLNGADRDEERADRLRVLIEVSMELGDDERAYHYCQALLAADGEQLEPLATMESIDRKRGDQAALARTLHRQAALLNGKERAELLMQVGRIHGDQLSDLEAAAVAYTEAIETDPGHSDALTALSQLFEAGGRFTELAALLDQQAERESDPHVRSEYLRQLARVRAELLHDQSGAAHAYQQLLSLEEDLPGLDFLAEDAARRSEHGEQAAYLSRAQALVTNADERRRRLLELATLEREENQRPQQAMQHLLLLLREVAPTDSHAAHELLELGAAQGHAMAEATALQTLVLNEQGPVALSHARRLVELQDSGIDTDLVRIGLERWAELAPEDAEPQQRLASLLAAMDDPAGSVRALAAFAQLSLDPEERRDAILTAARVSFEELSDPNAAWTFLLPYVEAGDKEAEARLRGICQNQGWVDRLINLHMSVARNKDTRGSERSRRWLLVAELFQTDLRAPTQAIEAAVRAVAADRSNPEALDRLDALCLLASASARLSQVYDRLIREAQSAEAKRALLCRHASLIERGLGTPEQAFERIANAYRLSPNDPELVQQLDRLATASGQGPALLALYGQQAELEPELLDRVDLYLRCADFSDRAMLDRPASFGHLGKALQTAANDSEACEHIWQLAAVLDKRHGPGNTDARNSLAAFHLQLAETMEASTGRALVLTAARMQREQMEDSSAALETLLAGVSLWPADDEIYERCLALAKQQDALQTLDRHLEAQERQAIDAQAAAALLGRRGALLEGSLERPEDAAVVFDKLLQLQPDNATVAEELRASLRSAGRHQDLLLAISKQLTRTKSGSTRLSLLKEAADTWELGLGNRYEALEAWRRVLQAEPEDSDAPQAIHRLAPKSLAPRIGDWIREAREGKARQIEEARARAAAEAEAEAAAKAVEESQLDAENEGWEDEQGYASPGPEHTAAIIAARDDDGKGAHADAVEAGADADADADEPSGFGQQHGSEEDDAPHSAPLNEVQTWSDWPNDDTAEGQPSPDGLMPHEDPAAKADADAHDERDERTIDESDADYLPSPFDAVSSQRSDETLAYSHWQGSDEPGEARMQSQPPKAPPVAAARTDSTQVGFALASEHLADNQHDDAVSDAENIVWPSNRQPVAPHEGQLEDGLPAALEDLGGGLLALEDQLDRQQSTGHPFQNDTRALSNAAAEGSPPQEEGAFSHHGNGNGNEWAESLPEDQEADDADEALLELDDIEELTGPTETQEASLPTGRPTAPPPVPKTPPGAGNDGSRAASLPPPVPKSRS